MFRFDAPPLELPTRTPSSTAMSQSEVTAVRGQLWQSRGLRSIHNIQENMEYLMVMHTCKFVCLRQISSQL
jgi:hypothetical protein